MKTERYQALLGAGNEVRDLMGGVYLDDLPKEEVLRRVPEFLVFSKKAFEDRGIPFTLGVAEAMFDMMSNALGYSIDLTPALRQFVEGSVPS